MTLLISVGLIAATLAVCDTVRRHLIPLVFSVDALAGKMATDALMAFELCATSFEMGAIFEHHGLATWSVGLFCLSFYQVSGGGSRENLCLACVALYDGKEKQGGGGIERKLVYIVVTLCAA